MINKDFWKNWNAMRVIRLGLGVFIIVQGIQTSEWMFVVLGGIFSLMPLLNIGCGGTNGCSTPRAPLSRTPGQAPKDITYEEVKNQ